jgi:prolyl-tRNA synthetase
VVIPVRDEPTVLDACATLADELRHDLPFRVVVDQGRGSFGRRVTDWEIKGVPVRVEVGPRDLAQGQVTVVRRDSGEKLVVTLAQARDAVLGLLSRIQDDMYASALAFRDDHTHDVATVDQAIDAAQSGFARLAWCDVGEDGEQRLKGEAVTVRCLQRADGSIPASDLEDGLVAIVAKSY